MCECGFEYSDDSTDPAVIVQLWQEVENGCPVIHFGRGETRHPAVRKAGCPTNQLVGNPYTQPAYFKNIKEIIKRSLFCRPPVL